MVEAMSTLEKCARAARKARFAFMPEGPEREWHENAPLDSMEITNANAIIQALAANLDEKAVEIALTAFHEGSEPPYGPEAEAQMRAAIAAYLNKITEDAG